MHSKHVALQYYYSKREEHILNIHHWNKYLQVQYIKVYFTTIFHLLWQGHTLPWLHPMLGYNPIKLFKGFVWFHFIVFKSQVVIFQFKIY